MNWENKNIVVTGASSGIGLELVKGFLEKGCRVVAADRATSSQSMTGEGLYSIQCDVSTAEGVDYLFTYALKTLGHIDIFVANAGFAYYEKLEEPDWEHIASIFNTNYHSVVYSAQKMKQLHGDQPYNFVTTSSGMSILPLPGYALYSSTKGAIRSFAEAYRWELDQGQYFQVVYPIATRTEFFKTAGNSPVPWPSQDVKDVARSILAGIRNNRNSIFPSKLFYAMVVVNKIIPVVFSIYSYVQFKKYKQWLNDKH